MSKIVFTMEIFEICHWSVDRGQTLQLRGGIWLAGRIPSLPQCTGNGSLEIEVTASFTAAREGEWMR